MSREFSVTALDDALAAVVMTATSSEVPLLLRAGLRFGSPDGWQEFLRSRCGFTLDRRHYGFDEKVALSNWWEISYQPDKATSYAYSCTRQPLHTDNAWFSDPAEINFFIMKKQASIGGSQMFYPLSRLIDDLASLEPGLLGDLCSVVVTIRKGDGNYFNRTTVIVNSDNPKIFWNFYRTEKPTRDIAGMCDAFFAFLERQEAASAVEEVRCESGDCFVFNDQKVLHGRQAFHAEQPYDRILYQSMWRQGS